MAHTNTKQDQEIDLTKDVLLDIKPKLYWVIMKWTIR